MTDKIESQTPDRRLTRKLADRTPESESESPGFLKKPNTLDTQDIDDLKAWFKDQIESLRADIRQDNTDLRNEISELRVELERKEKVIADLEGNVVSLVNRLDRAEAVVDSLKCDIRSLSDQAEEAEQYSKRPSLRISGLAPFQPKADFPGMVVELATKMGVKISRKDIDRAHPCGHDRKGLIVKFAGYQAKFDVYSNRRKLKTVSPGIYISEDLTRQRFNLLKKLLDLKKSNVISNAWSNDGRLFAWKQDVGKILIKSETEINNLR